VEEVFLLCLRALFDAVHVPEVAQPAKDLLIRLADSILDYEVQTIANSPGMRQPFPSPLETFLDSLPHGLTQSNPTQQEDSQNLVFNIIDVFLGVFARRNLSEKDYSPVIQQIANRFSSMCLDDLWVRKTVGCDALKRFVEWEKIGVRWILDRVVDNTRSLLHILKDLPSELTRGIADIIVLIKRVLEISATDEQEKMANHVASLSSVYFSELSSSNAAVRKTARECIDILVSKSGQSAYQLLLPHRDRMLNSIYTKPLRAFPFLIQIGMIEAVRYCMMSDPPLAELNDELLRLLHEALALADTEDDRLVTRPSRQANIELVHLRVSCIRILTAALPLTDFFSKQAQTRQRYEVQILI
jgi:transformation/transcription domain-associated protein